MNIELFNLGYYICKAEDTPEKLRAVSSKIISISPELCSHEPQIFFCHGWKPNGDRADYIKSLGFTQERYLEFSRDAQSLFDSGILSADGRFANKADADCFYRKYLNSPQYMLLSFATEEKYFNTLEECGMEHIEKVRSNGQNALGCEILQFDWSFDSFLSNSLHKGIKNIRFNEYGLIDMEYEKVRETAEKLDPYDSCGWVPVVVYLQDDRITEQEL